MLAFCCRQRLLEEVMGYAPRIPALICKELCTCHVENLPSVEPHCRVFLSVCFFKMGPYLFLIRVHLYQPILLSVRDGLSRTFGGYRN